MSIKFQLGTHHGKLHPTSKAPLAYVDVEMVNGSLDEYPGSFSGYMTPEAATLVLGAPTYNARVKELTDEMGSSYCRPTRAASNAHSALCRTTRTPACARITLRRNCSRILNGTRTNQTFDIFNRRQ
jgi:hypothetical protein